jgi:hypothetical protein
MRYWGIIRSAVSDRLSTKDIWDRIFQFEQQQQIARPTGLFAAVSAMRSAAVQIRESAARLTKAALDTAITAQHIAQELRSRPLTSQALAPVHVVRFESTVLTETGEERRWLSYVHRGPLPATKRALMDILDVQAPAIGMGSDELVTGTTGNVEIVAV